MHDDVLEVFVNDEPAATRLWDPYSVDITHLVRAGPTIVDLRVANTLANMLDGVERPSGLAGPPRIVPYRPFSLDLSSAAASQGRVP